MATLFVYGTLRHPDIVERIVGRRPEMHPATVTDWRAAPLRGRPYPGLVPSPDEVTTGAVIDVSDDELRALDRFEGDEYERVTLVADLGAGTDASDAPPGATTAVEVQVWTLRDECCDLALEGNWDLGAFLADGAAGFLS